ncbi:hypothetical protein IWX76_001285 [Pedobacter sp. CAN_A7]
MGNWLYKAYRLPFLSIFNGCNKGIYIFKLMLYLQRLNRTYSPKRKKDQLDVKLAFFAMVIDGYRPSPYL